MPYNGSGIYSLPLANVVGGTTITATWANTTLPDVAAALTNALCKDGQSSMSGALNMGGQVINNLAAGSAASPSLNITGDVNTGLYSGGADIIGVTTGGVSRQVWLANGRSLVGRTVDSGNATFQVESNADSNLLELKNTAAASFGGLLLSSNDRTFSILQYSSTHANAGKVFLDTNGSADVEHRVNGVAAVKMESNGGTPIIRAMNGVWFSSSATATTYVAYKNGTQLDIIGGTSGFRVVNVGNTNANLTVTDAGAVSARTSLSAPIIDATSHAKFKQSIEYVTALDIIKDIRLRRYELKAVPGVKRLGFIYDELPEILRSGDEAVSLYGIASTALAGVAELTQILKEKGLVKLAC